MTTTEHLNAIKDKCKEMVSAFPPCESTAGWNSTIAAIDALRGIAWMEETGQRDLSWTGRKAFDTLNTIIAAWPEEDSMKTDTPETDEVARKLTWDHLLDFARKLERERDEARELLREIRDGEVNPEDEADKYLRDHVCSELSKEREKVKLLCRDWADDDTRIKEIAKRHGIDTEYGDAVSGYFKTCVDVAEKMSERIAELESKILTP
jgi:hypothetical protein